MSFGWGIEEGIGGRGRDNGIEFDEDLPERELRAFMYRVVESRVRVPASEDMAAGENDCYSGNCTTRRSMIETAPRRRFLWKLVLCSSVLG